jgi:hypothetical protein
VGQSEIAAITVPLGFVGVIHDAALRIDRGGSFSADAALMVRRNGQNGYVRKNLVRGSNTLPADVDPGVVYCPALTDVKLRVTAVSTTNVDIAGQFNYLFMKV